MFLSLSGGARWSRMENERSRSPLFENPVSCELDEKVSSLDQVRWLTSSEAAQYLRISVSSLKMMVYRGQVRVRKLGRRNRFLREELERLFTISSNKKEK